MSPLALPGTSEELQGALAAGMARVDATLREVVRYDDPFIASASGHLLAAGGKRFRPLLTLLAAQTAGGINEQTVHAAAAVELTHLASLYHDDVMDEAAVRRGVPSFNAAYDNTTAILVGDLLFGQASALVAGLGAEAVKIQAQTFVRLCAGQIRDARPRPRDVDAVDYYFAVLADKTGVLIGTSALYGGMFAGASAAHCEVLRAYGEQLGVAFQLADDLIDVTSDPSESGKTPGTDLREGIDTLPTLLAKADMAPEHARLRELLGSDLSGEGNADRHTEALSLLRAHPAIEAARARTRAVGDEAVATLGELPESEAKTALVALVTSVVDRVT